jgi:hypothetical protein
MKLKPRDGVAVSDPITRLPIEGEIDLSQLPTTRQIALLRLVADGALVEVQPVTAKKAEGGK